jgi:riboflavin synthase
MFTGIVQAIGEITQATPARDSGSAPSKAQDGQMGLRLLVAANDLPLDDVQVGDSIAMNGACMTVVAMDSTSFQVDVSRESLNCTTGLDRPGRVNLEKAMRASDRLGGHLVSGHVDGVGRVTQVLPVGESWQLVVAIPAALSPFLSDKGSVTVQGVSLTINAVIDHAHESEIQINLIPHTWQATTLHELQPGSLVNIEVDQLAKQVARILKRLEQLS